MAELPKSVGWIGLGAMGFHMAANLVKKLPADTHFYVFDVVQDFVDKFVEQYGVRVHGVHNAKEVADESDVIFSMVPEGSHVRAVYLTPETGVLASDLGPKILIDCSTIDTGTSLAVRHETVKKHPKARFYDAPVSGGVIGAERGTLTFMVGCAEDNSDYRLLNSLLSLMGGNIFACGGASLGLTAKLCNNYTSSLISIATVEAMNIGMAAGMDPRVLANIFHTSTAQSAICDDWNPVPGICPDAPASKSYKGGFRINLMRKDVGLAIDSADRLGVKLAIGREGWKVYDEASRDPRCEGRDSRVIYRYLGGNEEWSKKFPGELPMKRDETRALLKKAREMGL